MKLKVNWKKEETSIFKFAFTFQWITHFNDDN